jgi:rubrerythrin
MMKVQIKDLLCQALETEKDGVKIYETAISCAVNEDLKKEWMEYHEQTTRHVAIVEEVFAAVGLDTTEETPGRGVVRHIGESLIKAMEMAKANGSPEAAQAAAAECVVLAETKDHLNWHLIGELAKNESGDLAKALKKAHDEIEDEEDEHLYHTSGWTRELWIDALGMPAVLPPPEEEKKVKTAIGAARAAHARTDMI